MNSDFAYVSHCNLCEKQNLKHVLHVTQSPLANSFVKEPIEQKKYPLDLLECQDCGHVQLSVIINPELMFKDYLYVSGTSQVFVKHFENYATTVINKLDLKENDLVVDVGSNDGTLLQFFKNADLKVVGIDPAEDIAKQATDRGIPTIPDFLNEKSKKQVFEEYGGAKVVVANNVFAHSSELNDMAKNISHLIRFKEGVFVFEVSYLPDLINGLYFDNIYHEHVSFHHLAPLIEFFNKHHMRVFDVERANTHGGSIRVYVENKYRQDRNERPVNIEAIGKLLQLESDMGLKVSDELRSRNNFNIIGKNFVSPFLEFADKMKDIKFELKARLKELKAQGNRIVGYGAPAKSTTLLHYLGIDNELIDYIVDDSPLKQNLLTPGTHIRIWPTNQIYDYGFNLSQNRDADVILILAWNFAESIIKNHSKFGGKFIIPLPIIEER